MIVPNLPVTANFRADVLQGLRSEPKFLPTKYLYDRRGSELFEDITTLPEYYLTRSEQAIMDAHASEILTVEPKPDEIWLVELGAGSGKKTRALLNVLANAYAPGKAHYYPIDIADEFLASSNAVLQQDFPTLPMHPVCAEFSAGLEYVARERDTSGSSAQVVVYFPGSTIGNLTRQAAAAFMHQMRDLLHDGDVVLLAVDMSAGGEKSVQMLHDAYNDAAGVTAAFNLNILHRINRELEATIPTQDYRHVAYYNTQQSRVELFLESTTYHTFRIGEEQISMGAGERIHTEYSHKTDDASMRNLTTSANFTIERVWKDPRNYFGLYRLQAS
jgi:dimethylhistidine N-methyltransferase